MSPRPVNSDVRWLPINRMFRLLFSIILVGVFACIVQPQDASPLNVSIKVDNRIFQRAHPAVVHVKIKWGVVPDAQAKTLQAVSLLLTKPGTKRDFCTRADCLGAAFSLPNQLAPKNGEVIEFDVTLNELYWNDIVSSQYDFSRPKNMFDVIPVGAYFLTVSAGFRANYSTKRDPRIIAVASNSMFVEMR
jgi:hypothetical protein